MTTKTFVALAIGAWVTFWIGVYWGKSNGQSFVRSEAVAQGHGHYDPKTAEFKWGAP